MPDKHKPLSRRNRMTGYLMLGLGIAAVLTVMALAAIRFSPALKSAAVETPAKPGPARAVSASRLEGGWEAAFLDYTALLHFENGTYQILALRSASSAPRSFSRGRYSLDGALLTMTPDRAMGTPGADDPAHKYLPLHQRPFTVDVRFQKDRQIWFSGPVDPGFPNTNPVHPLIQFTGDESLIWTRKK